MKEGLKVRKKTWVSILPAARAKLPVRHPGNRGFLQKLCINPAPLIYASRISAKVDNNAVQDGYQIYQHTFLFLKDSCWAVVQQG